MGDLRFDTKLCLPPEFYQRKSVEVARDLLGALVLVKDRRGALSGGKIVEVEAYSGSDPASHSAKGLTPRCAPMFEAGGIAYVYFIYGMYDMLNFVTEVKGFPGAVLIRAIEPLLGLDQIKKRRKNIPRKNFTNGPGRLTLALAITRQFNEAPLQGPKIFVLPGEKLNDSDVCMSPRVGISSGQDLLWRFFVAGHRDVSQAIENQFAKKYCLIKT